MSPGANALVLELDELVASTGPGAAYCPDASSSIPTVTTVLGTPANDAIVTTASQVAGCSGGCVSQAFLNLAHTNPTDSVVLKMFGLSYKNILASSGVDAFVACKLANTACGANKPEGRLASSTKSGGNSDHRWAEQSGSVPVLRKIKPLLIPPPNGVMGDDVSFGLKVPFDQVIEVSINQLKNGRGYDNDVAKVSRAPDGTTRVTVTPLLAGDVRFDIVTTMTNHEFVVSSINLTIASPDQPPLLFLADQACRTAALKTCVSRMHVGMEYNLWPLLILRAAPEKEINVGQFSSYKTIQDAAQPVIALKPDGSYKALRDGRATIVVSYSGYQTSEEVIVDSSFPLMIDPSR